MPEKTATPDMAYTGVDEDGGVGYVTSEAAEENFVKRQLTKVVARIKRLF